MTIAVILGSCLEEWKHRRIVFRELTQRRRWRQRGRKKIKRFRLTKQQLYTWIMLFCTFLCRRCTTTTWKRLISRFVGDVNARQRLCTSFPTLRYSLLEFNSRKKLQHLTNWLRWNKRDKDWGSACSLFKWRFRCRCRCRRRRLSSPFCFPDDRDNRALADDIDRFFRHKISNIRNEIRIVRAAMKEEDKVEDDSVVMENQRIYEFRNFSWEDVRSLVQKSAKRPAPSPQCQHLWS